MLRPGAEGGLVIATGDIVEAPRARAARTRWWIRTLALGAVAVQLSALPYQLAVFSGTTQSALVQRSHLEERSGKGKTFQVLVVTYQVGNGPPRQDETDRDNAALLAADSWVPVRVSPLGTTLGPQPTLRAELAILPTLLLCVLCGYALWSRQPRRWYETETGKAPAR